MTTSDPTADLAVDGAGARLVHVLGRASAGDPTTAAARALCRGLADAGRPGHLVAARGSLTGIGPADATALGEGELVVHSVDGGEDLTALLADLADRPLHLVHHGSAVGSDRRALRVLRGGATSAAAASPAAREELRALGFGTVAVLPPGSVDGGLDDVSADAETVENLERHPGPRLVCVGPIAPNRSLELLLDAFADLVTGLRPSATLSLCGPSTPWYASTLRRRILTRGLLACELVSPGDDGAVVARLDRADAVVALHPAGLDPYLYRAARAGARVVAPLDAATASLPPGALLPLPAAAGRRGLVDALHRATSHDRAQPPATSSAAPTVGHKALRRILGIG